MLEENLFSWNAPMMSDWPPKKENSFAELALLENVWIVSATIASFSVNMNIKKNRICNKQIP